MVSDGEAAVFKPESPSSGGNGSQNGRILSVQADGFLGERKDKWLGC